MKTKILFAIFLIVLVSCDKENNKPSDEFKLKSNQYTGFSFEQMKVINYPSTESIKPDFFVAAQTLDNGDVVSPFFSNPDMESRFFLSGSIENYERALNEYNTIAIPENFQLEQFALNLQPNQVWLIKTNSEKYGVLLIESAEFNNFNDTPYAETAFKARIIN